ncbi:hypothetical protein BDP55DRAFT_110154 [Colletotrichum godetiae]|uniref:Uncharacterized protein n=1 Tax=Colletotrichum godetiae TaxID=1209918 RepID=A0AAJ0AQW1_9PEZI|nr:uncharacterized protein BDP55DRAFT_110154 [Colletotrichum godetiae]KAK1676171.1 hypothetical protein BDP55DRAFT_110154 [Colletotrichum godetiae]
MFLLSNSLVSLVGVVNSKTALQLLVCGRSQIVSSVDDPSCPNVKHQLHLSLPRNNVGNRREYAALPYKEAASQESLGRIQPSCQDSIWFRGALVVEGLGTWTVSPPLRRTSPPHPA